MRIIILGRQPKLGLAELESLYGADAVQPIGREAAIVTTDTVHINRLGGALKIAKPLIELRATGWRDIAAYIADQLPHHLGHLPDGKIKIGLSVYGLTVTSQQLLRTGLELKKVCRAAGRSARIVPNTAPVLNSAQVLRNQLTGELGMELILIKNGTRTWLAQTIAAQDVDEYARRDHGRPKRDAFVGMLPPKLAQQMLNLAQVQPGQTVLDPFCGTGVVLQEALLAGAKAYGSDLSQKMVDYTAANLVWLSETYNIEHKTPLELADATNHHWPHNFDHVVCETYLGQPLSGLPKPDKLNDIVGTCNKISTEFLKNLAAQTAPGSRHCIAVPTWRTSRGFTHLRVLDHLEEIGYNRLRFQHASESELIYWREDQIVARELLVIQRRA